MKRSAFYIYRVYAIGKSMAEKLLDRIEIYGKIKIVIIIVINKLCFITSGGSNESAHKYFAFSSLICMAMAIYSGHKMISGKSRKKKETAAEEAAE